MTDKTKSTAQSLEQARIAQIFIRARDLERAIAFYRDVLGFKFLFQAPPQMAFFDCSGVRLLLGVPEKQEFDHPSSIIYFEIADIQSVFQTLKKRGVTFLAEPHVVHRGEGFELWLAEFNDSEDNTLALMSTIAK